MNRIELNNQLMCILELVPTDCAILACVVDIGVVEVVGMKFLHVDWYVVECESKC